MNRKQQRRISGLKLLKPAFDVLGNADLEVPMPVTNHIHAPRRLIAAQGFGLCRLVSRQLAVNSTKVMRNLTDPQPCILATAVVGNAHLRHNSFSPASHCTESFPCIGPDTPGVGRITLGGKAAAAVVTRHSCLAANAAQCSGRCGNRVPAVSSAHLLQACYAVFLSLNRFAVAATRVDPAVHDPR